MSLSVLNATICFIACHGGPADHFATFAETLVSRGFKVQMYATGPALKKFQERHVEGITAFSLESLNPEEEEKLALRLAKTCSTALCVLTDVGHPFDIKIQKALSLYPRINRLAYYDNPENFVPGGYSSTAAAVMKEANKVLFANEILTTSKIFGEKGVEVNLENIKRIGIGYYPVAQALEMALKRDAEQGIARSEFLNRHGIEENGQKIDVYFGGNNDEYFYKAFPAFLSLLSKGSKKIDGSNMIVIVQQHPGAKEKNLDGQQLSIWLKENKNKEGIPKVILSDLSLDQAQVLAYRAFYYQTSMGPHFILSGIHPVQIGHEVYKDILVRNNLVPTITQVDQWVKFIKNSENDVLETNGREGLLKSLGIREDWVEVLVMAVTEM